MVWGLGGSIKWVLGYYKGLHGCCVLEGISGFHTGSTRYCIRVFITVRQRFTGGSTRSSYMLFRTGV